MHYVHELYKSGDVHIEWTSTKNQLADTFTKALPRDKFIEFRSIVMCSSDALFWIVDRRSRTMELTVSRPVIHPPPALRKPCCLSPVNCSKLVYFEIHQIINSFDIRHMAVICTRTCLLKLNSPLWRPLALFCFGGKNSVVWSWTTIRSALATFWNPSNKASVCFSRFATVRSVGYYYSLLISPHSQRVLRIRNMYLSLEIC